jgi:hypothetical protein
VEFGVSPTPFHCSLDDLRCVKDASRYGVRAKGARARDSTDAPSTEGRTSTSAKSFFVHHTQQLAAAAQVGDAKGIRNKITEMRMRLIKDALKATGRGYKAVRGPARRLIEYGCDNRGSRGPRASVHRIRMYAGLGCRLINIGCESYKHWL